MTSRFVNQDEALTQFLNCQRSPVSCRAFSFSILVLVGRRDSNPGAKIRNPLSENILGNCLVDKSVNSQCLDGSTCHLMAEADSDLLHIGALWGQLPDHLRITIMMLIDACGPTEHPENE